MPPTKSKQVVESLWQQREATLNPKPPIDLGKALFDAQRPFGLDLDRYQTACCTRRSGKTVGLLAKLLKTAQSKPDSVALYITLSRKNAKALAWEIIKKLNLQFEVGGEPNESDLCLSLPNGARIYLTGCTDIGEVEKFRGPPLSICVIDEAQSFPSLLLKKLIDEVLAPGLMDFAGQLVLVGTPGPVPQGYFYECIQSLEWKHHGWSVFQNPWIQLKSGRTPQELLHMELKRRGVTIEDPVIQREWFGKWVLDLDALVFKYNAAVNHRPFPDTIVHKYHVIGCDIGYSDADAIAVLGWNDDSPNVQLVYEEVKAKQNLTPYMDRIVALDKKYKPLAITMDYASLGPKVANEITMRSSVPVEAADKMRKLEHIEWLNDAMRTQRFFAPRDSRYAQDCALVEWDRNNAEHPEKPTISTRYHSDINDAILYAFTKALAWLHKPSAPKAPPINTYEWYVWEKARQLQEIHDSFAAQEQRIIDERREEDPMDWLQ